MDGTPSKIVGNTDEKLIHLSEIGVCTVKIKLVGCPELVLERRQVGDEVQTEATLADIVIEFAVVKTWYLEMNLAIRL